MPRLESRSLWMNAYRPRRSFLSVPGSNRKMIEKAKGLPADEVFLDLEDAVAPLAKAQARAQSRGADRAGLGGQLRWCGSTTGPPRGPTPTSSRWCDGAGAPLDAILLPKVTDAGHVHALDLLLTQLEKANGLDVGRIGIEPQIENAAGCATSTRSRPRAPGCRPWCSVPPTSWRASTCARWSSASSRRATTPATPTTTS